MMQHEQCANCGHTFSFHSKRAGERCKAIGCHAGPEGRSCRGFTAREGASEALVAALSTPA